MPSGIYALYWWKQDLVYIGQAQNISSRFSEHNRKLKGGVHSNYRVQDAFNRYGIPDCIEVQSCSVSELNSLEVFWTKEFNSLKTTNGLNIVEAGEVGYGPNANASKHPKCRILRVFSLLYSTDLTYIDIGNKTNINNYTIRDIAKGLTHSWLQIEYPVQYAKMINRCNRLVSTNTASIGFISPDGVVYTGITSITIFVRTILNESENFIKGLSKVSTGNRDQYKGWKIYENY